MSKRSLKIKNKFYSIQEEGKHYGKPTIFLMLSGDEKDAETPVEEVLDSLDIDRIKNGAHLTISGAEPLFFEKEISELITYIKIMYDFAPFVIIETSGTLLPMKKLIFDVKQWNVNAKLLNSGIGFDLRFKLDILKRFNELNSVFKFIILEEECIVEIFNNYHFVNRERIYLMPFAEQNKKEVWNFCKKYILKFSDRLNG